MRTQNRATTKIGRKTDETAVIYADRLVRQQLSSFTACIDRCNKAGDNECVAQGAHLLGLVCYRTQALQGNAGENGTGESRIVVPTLSAKHTLLNTTYDVTEATLSHRENGNCDFLIQRLASSGQWVRTVKSVIVCKRIKRLKK